MGRIDCKEFAFAVRDVVCAIPKGKVLTYGDVASLAGSPAHSRMVGRILSMIGPDTDVPCHRVVNSEGRTAPHWHTQSVRLKSEGVTIRQNGTVDMARHRWYPEIEL